jgi:hypothetical protein
MNRAEERLLNPPPGGRIEAALDLQRAINDLEALHGKGRVHSDEP